MSKLSFELTEKQNTMLAAVTNHSKVKGNHGLMVPNNVEELKKYWSGGPNSINQNLPFPKPEQIEGTEFAYLSLEDIIRHSLTTSKHPHPFDSFTNSPH